MSIKTVAVSGAGGVKSLYTAKYAIYLAKMLGARLAALYVVDDHSLKELLKTGVFVAAEAAEYDEELEDQGKSFLDRVKKMAQSKGVECDPLLLRGLVHEVVVNKLKEINADILVIGELKEVCSRKEVFYEAGERMFREAHCPVVVVKNQEMVDKFYQEI
jgi:nucleotide-binding universal stress UspA family protein